VFTSVSTPTNYVAARASISGPTGARGSTARRVGICGGADVQDNLAGYTDIDMYGRDPASHQDDKARVLSKPGDSTAKTSGPSADAASRHGDNRTKGSSDVVKAAWITGFCAIVVAIIGAVAAFATGLIKPGDTISQPPETVTQPVTVTAPTSPAATTGPRSADIGTSGSRYQIRHTTETHPRYLITLSAGYYVDLDSTRPDWGVDHVYPKKSRDDISWDGSGTGTLIGYGGELAVARGPATPHTCAAATGYGSVYWQQMKLGAAFCVRTSKRRLAYLKLEKYDPDDTASVTFAATVWDPPNR
jgi:hypothetical protein